MMSKKKKKNPMDAIFAVLDKPLQRFDPIW